MLFIIGNQAELFQVSELLPQDVYLKIFEDITIMDAAYGDDRDYLCSGGYSLVLQNEQDLNTVLEFFNYREYPYEWADMVTNDYVSAVFVFNNDFSVTLYMPLSICPKDFIDFKEDFIL